jgi:hypothetical protein
MDTTPHKHSPWKQSCTKNLHITKHISHNQQRQFHMPKKKHINNKRNQQWQNILGITISLILFEKTSSTQKIHIQQYFYCCTYMLLLKSIYWAIPNNDRNGIYTQRENKMISWASFHFSSNGKADYKHFGLAYCLTMAVTCLLLLV